MSVFVLSSIFFLTYVIFIPWLGFYWDDWEYLWIQHTRGIQGLAQEALYDRPITGYIQGFFGIFLGESPLFHQLMVNSIRQGTGIFLFLLFRMLWRKHAIIYVTAPLLFLLYPGILQNPIPYVYKHFHIAVLLEIISIYLSILTIHQKKGKFVILLIASLLLSITSWLIREAFIGMELIRYMFLWVALQYTQIRKVTLKEYFLYLTPYVFTAAAFFIWYVFLFSSKRTDISVSWAIGLYKVQPFMLVTRSIGETIIAFIQAVILAWIIPCLYRFMYVPPLYIIFSFVLGLIGSGIYVSHMNQLQCFYKQTKQESQEDKKIGFQLLMIGIVSFVFCVFPVIFSGRSVRLILGAYDRFLLSLIVSSVLVCIGFVIRFFGKKRQTLIFAVLIGVSICTHVNNAYFYMERWDSIKNMWWQLSWRAPKIESGTNLVFVYRKPPLIAAYELWGAANLFYNSQTNKLTLFGEPFTPRLLSKLKDKEVEEGGFNTITFSVDYNSSIVVIPPTKTTCLTVLNSNDTSNDAMSPQMREAAHYSHSERIMSSADSPSPAAAIFGKEPGRTWCYYFQKASLARQLEKWEDVYQLGKEVQNRNLMPYYPQEWEPFVKGYVMLGKQAELLMQTRNSDKSEYPADRLYRRVCSALSKKEVSIPGVGIGAVHVYDLLACDLFLE